MIPAPSEIQIIHPYHRAGKKRKRNESRRKTDPRKPQELPAWPSVYIRAETVPFKVANELLLRREKK